MLQAHKRCWSGGPVGSHSGRLHGHGRRFPSIRRRQGPASDDRYVVRLATRIDSAVTSLLNGKPIGRYTQQPSAVIHASVAQSVGANGEPFTLGITYRKRRSLPAAGQELRVLGGSLNA